MENNNTIDRSEYELNHERMKAWNERRAINEKNGLEKFYSLKQTFADFKKLQQSKKFSL